MEPLNGLQHGQGQAKGGPCEIDGHQPQSDGTGGGRAASTSVVVEERGVPARRGGALA